jgi:hypothetical protein
MASIPGGPSDKLGNEFERLWTIRQLVKVISGEAVSVTIEALGEDERGTEFWVDYLNGTREAHQCKRENGSNGDWSMADLFAKDVFPKAKLQLDRSPEFRFVFASADKAPAVADLCERARRGDNADVFCRLATSTSQHLKNEFNFLCRNLSLDPTKPSDQAVIKDFLRRFDVVVADKSRLRADVEELMQAWVSGNPSEIVGQFESLISRNETMGKALREADVVAALPTGCRIRDLGKDSTLPTKIRELRERFRRSYRHLLIQGKPLGRPEADDIKSKLTDENGPRLMLIHGVGGCGKTGVVYEVIEKLDAASVPCLPLRLDRDKPGNSPSQFGSSLDLPASPSACIAAISRSGPGVLILDQLDAIRWTAQHAAYDWDTCERLIDEALRHPNLRVVLVCRTFDAEEDPRIKAWRKKEEKQVKDVKLSGINDATLDRVLGEKQVPTGSLSSGQRRILSSPQSLYLWLELFSARSQLPTFLTTTDLMDAYWSHVRSRLPAGVDLARFDLVLSTIVADMDQRGLPFSSATVVNVQSPEIIHLLSVNILIRNNRQLLFSHQSHLDYLTADQLSREVSAGNRRLIDWLVENDQSLFRRGQLRQLLALLRERNPTKFIESMSELIQSPRVRFHLQHLALQVLANIEVPNQEETAFLIKLLEDDTWVEHVAWQVLPRRVQWFDALYELNLFDRWIAGSHERRKFIALNVAESVISDRPKEVEFLTLSGRHGRLSRAKSTIWRVKPESLSEQLFRAYCVLIRRGDKDAVTTDWESLARTNPRRTIRVFHAQISNQLNIIESAIRKTKTGQARERATLDRKEGKALQSAAALEPEFAWHCLRPVLARASTAAVKARRRRMRNYDSISFDDFYTMGAYQRHLVRIMTSAGRAIAEGKPEIFKKLIELAGNNRSRVMRRVIARSIIALPDQYAELAIQWLLSDERNFDCGSPKHHSSYEATAYGPAVVLMRRFIPLVGPDLLKAAESRIVRYVPKSELRDFRYRHEDFMAHPTGWIHSRSLFVAQYLLLSTFPRNGLSFETLRKIGVLARKFGDHKTLLKRRPSGAGGWVGSTIPKEKLRLVSDRQWLNVVQRDWSTRQRSWRQLGPGSVGEVSVRVLSRDLGAVARIEPSRIARLALEFPLEIDRAYLESTLNALAETRRPENAMDPWAPASIEAIEAIFRRFATRLSTREVAQTFCWLIRKRPDEPWTDETLRQLVDIAINNPDPKIDEYAVHRGNGNEMKPARLDTSLNCVRGAATETICALLFTQRDRISLFKPAIDSLVNDPHDAVRIAAVGLALPIRNSDRRRGAETFALACSHPDYHVLESHHIDEFLSYALLENSDLLLPIINRMLSCPDSKIVERGANWVGEAWLHKGQWPELFDQVISGSSSQRLGVLAAIVRAVLDDRGGERALALLTRAFDDAEQEVRDKAASIFRHGKFFNHALAVRITEVFINSKALDNNIDDFIYGLHDETISLRPFASALALIAKELTTPVDDQMRALRRTTNTSMLAGLLLRLYEQSENDPQCRRLCLDAWDKLLQENSWGVLEKLDE